MEQPLPEQPTPPRRLSFWDRCTRIADVLFTVLGMIAVLGILYLCAGKANGHDPHGVFALEGYDTTATVRCLSQSMGLVIKCDDTLLLRNVAADQNLTPGHIYTYAAPGNRSIVHRYVACTDNCQTLIMKGDNNLIPEIINRANITYEVIGAYYDPS